MAGVAVSIFGASSAIAANATDRIRYDAQCLTINGQDTLIYSGAFHYFRCPKPLWAERLQSMKSAGLNTLETYVAWNWHEQSPPADVSDTSKIDLTDLHDFLDLAINRFGFNVMIRPGPYICAEWDGGGYPQWLLTKRPANFKGHWFRGDDPTYLAWCKHWYDAVAKVAAPFQITHQPEGKPGIILWQLENEYNYDNHPDEVKLNQLVALAHVSRDDGIDVPLFTCMTESKLYRKNPYLLANVIDTRNDYPRFDYKEFIGNIDYERPYQPDKPLMMTELQGGWFANVGGKLSQAEGMNGPQITHITMLAWAHGYTSTNYYMMFGGTNFGDWAAAGITTTYDYAAPIREPGGVDERYQAVSSMAHMIQQIGPKLVRAELEKSHVDGDAPTNVSAMIRRAIDGTRFVFVFNNSKESSAMGTLKLALEDSPGTSLSVEVDLKPFDAKVLVLPANELDAGKGEWLPRIQPLPERPGTLPEAIVVKTIKHAADPGPTDWKPLTGDRSGESAGVFDRRFLYYRATLPGKLPFAHTAVQCDTAIPETIAAGSQLMTGKSPTFAVDPADAGKPFNAIFENHGRENIGANLEAPGGITSIKLVDADAASKVFGDWKIHKLGKGEKPTTLTGADVDTSKWDAFTPAIAEELTPSQAAVYRCNFDVSADDLAKHKSVLKIGRIDDHGTIFVNGKKVGESHVWDMPIEIDVAKQLHAGANTVAVIVRNENGPGGLGLGVSLAAADSIASLPYDIGTQCTGDARHWYAADFDDRQWTDSPTITTTPQLQWYRMHFALPAPPAHAWVPLKLRLAATGDGFLYLNGHPLGRWWERGPQTEYYLPECWLNRDGGNVIAVSLLSSADRAGVQSASVMPYDDLSETRP